MSLQNGTIWKFYFENLYQKITPADLNQPQSNIQNALKDLEKKLLKITKIH